MQRTLRSLTPSPQGLVHSDHGPENHWAGHSSGPWHSRSASGFCSASQFDSSAFLIASPSNLPQTTVLDWVPLPQTALHFVHCEENHECSQGGATHALDNSGFFRFSQNFSSYTFPAFDAQWTVLVSVVAPQESH